MSKIAHRQLSTPSKMDWQSNIVQSTIQLYETAFLAMQFHSVENQNGQENLFLYNYKYFDLKVSLSMIG